MGTFILDDIHGDLMVPALRKQPAIALRRQTVVQQKQASGCATQPTALKGKADSSKSTRRVLDEIHSDMGQIWQPARSDARQQPADRNRKVGLSTSIKTCKTTKAGASQSNKDGKNKKKKCVSTPQEIARSEKKYSEVLGSVEETDAQHRRSCTLAENCPRCFWSMRTQEIKRVASISTSSSGGVRKKLSWISHRPLFLGGDWALGCFVCAAATACRTKHSVQNQSIPCQYINSRARLGCRWAQYKINRISTFSALHAACSAHATRKGHRLAVAALQSSQTNTVMHLSLVEAPFAVGGALYDVPACGGTLVASPSSGTARIVKPACEYTIDAELFKGRVPQVHDWVDANAEIRGGMAFRKMQTVASLKGEVVDRKARVKQLHIMADCCREGIRKRFRESESITLSVDDSKRRKVIRYRCDRAVAVLVNQNF
jgi:hypothetical protein